MFNKDTFRLIRSTFNRFLSLFMIVLVASGFMMGLFSNGTIMRESVDIYNDEYNLQDVQFYSSYGFCDEDIKAIRENEDVKDVFASKYVDVYGMVDNGYNMVYRVEELDRDVNQYVLNAGRMPQRSNEALLLYESMTSAEEFLGKKIKVYLNDKDIHDYLFWDEYTVVGTCSSPAYTSRILGPSNCENQDLEAVLFVSNKNFMFDYYTTIYATLKDADSFISYTDPYEEFVDEHMVSLQTTKNHQEAYLRDKIYDENSKKLADARKEFEEEKEKGQKELDDAKKELDDANIELIVSQSLIDSNRVTIETSWQQIYASEDILEANERQVNDGIRQAESESGMSFDELYAEVSAAYTSYIMLKQTDIDATNVSDRIVKELTEEKENNLARIEEIDAQIEALDPEAEDYTEQFTQLTIEKQSLQIRNTIIDQTLENYTENPQEIADQSKEDMMKAIDDQFGGSVEKTYVQLRTLYEARDKINASRIELEAGKESARQGEEALNEAQAELDAGKRKYEAGLKEYNEGLMNFNDEIEKAENDLKKAEEELADLPNAEWVLLDRGSQYSSYMYKSNVAQMSAIGYAMPFLFFLVAALVCMTTMTRLIDEQRSQIGIFMALGFSSLQIIGKYVLYALLASLGGSIIGIAIGQLIFPTVIYNTWRLMYALPPIRLYYPIEYIVICILAFAVLMGGVTFFVVRGSLQEMPSQLLRPKAPKSSKRVFLEKIDFLWRRLPFTSKITARNIFRYKARFLMTVIGVAGCTALLVMGFGIKDSISDLVTNQYGKIFAYDYDLNFENDHHLNENLDILKDNLDNKEVVPFMSYTTKAYLSDKDDETLIVEVFDARESKQVLNLRKTDKKTPLELDNSGVIVSEKFARNNKLKEGDYITIESENGLKREVRIAGICEFYFQHYVFISEMFYEDTFGENVHYNYIAVKSDNQEALKADTEKLEDFVSMTDFSGMIEQFETMINALDLIIAVIILAAGSLALVVLLNLIQVNVAERIREIATLKVLGFHDGEVNSYIFKEVFLLTIIGAVLGFPLGLLEHHFIMNVINMDMIMFGMTIKPLSYVYSFAITMVFTVVVSMFMRRPLANIQMVESLKSVE